MMQRLEIRQSLFLTPQSRLTIELLPLSNADLAAYVERELERNPLLERDDGSSQHPNADTEVASRPISADPDTTGSKANFSETERPVDARQDDLWIDEAAPRDNWSTSWTARDSTNAKAKDFGVERIAGKTTTLREQIIQQVGEEIRDPVERSTASYLAEQLDESGRLTCTVENAASDLGTTQEEVEHVLKKLQTFDPSGVFARDLAECFAIQLREKNRLDPAIQALLDNLEILKRRDFRTLKRVCGVDTEDLEDMVAEIGRLNPKPADDFDQVIAQPVIPDVLMRPDGNGGWALELNTETLPRVLINSHYHQIVSERGGKDKSYVDEQLQSANRLAKAMHQRATTVLKVSAEIVRQQDGFFRHGVMHLRPLILRDVADATGRSESTISRVTSNKYITTPRGVYELKYFFTRSVRSSSGDPHSDKAVRSRIKSLIDGETADAVLSDEQIRQILQAEGIKIARRTVAKYRNKLRIPASPQRGN